MQCATKRIEQHEPSKIDAHNMLNFVVFAVPLKIVISLLWAPIEHSSGAFQARFIQRLIYSVSVFLFQFFSNFRRPAKHQMAIL
jgi:hypothetical protein